MATYADGIKRLRPSAKFAVHANSDGSIVIAKWIDAAAPPTHAEILAAMADIDAEQAAQQNQKQQTQNAVFSTASSAAGVAINNLTAPQVRALMAVMLWRMGGLDDNLVVRPIASWAVSSVAPVAEPPDVFADPVPVVLNVPIPPADAPPPVETGDIPPREMPDMVGQAPRAVWIGEDRDHPVSSRH